MSLLSGVSFNDANSFSSLGDVTNTIKNPFEQTVDAPFRGEDFPEGFIIEELDFSANNKVKTRVRLVGNMMPKRGSFKFGGAQRIKKDYYAGHSEPVAHVLGPKESDMSVKGEFKDKRYKLDKFRGVAREIQKLVDSIRIRGNLCRFVLGDWQRYGFIESDEFNLDRLTRIDYEINLSIIGFNAPQNAKFLQRPREIPFNINSALISAASDFQAANSNIPASVPRSAADLIDSLTSDVAGAINQVTGFVDSVFTTVQDVRKSIDRALGLIKHTQNTLRRFKRQVGGLNPFTATDVTGRYTNASFYAGIMAGAVGLSALLAKYRTQFRDLAQNNEPLAAYTTVTGDTLQKISVKFYGTADNWTEIKDYNKLQNTQLETGTRLDIPKLQS